MATRCVVVKLPSIRKANIRDMQYDLPFIANQAKFAADPKYITMSGLRSVIRRESQTAAANRRAG
jgi:hypothetical protein